jgi:hypothetical protein
VHFIEHLPCMTKNLPWKHYDRENLRLGKGASRTRPEAQPPPQKSRAVREPKSAKMLTRNDSICTTMVRQGATAKPRPAAKILTGNQNQLGVRTKPRPGDSWLTHRRIGQGALLVTNPRSSEGSKMSRPGICQCGWRAFAATENRGKENLDRHVETERRGHGTGLTNSLNFDKIRWNTTESSWSEF